MSNDFEKVLITDDKLDIQNKIKFGVFRGGSSVNYQTFNALSKSANSQTFSIQIPSESVAVDRRVLWRCKVVIKLTGTAVRPAGVYLFDYGKTDGWAAFPLHQMVNNMTAQINSTSVNFQTSDLLPAIMRILPEDMLGHFNSYTPTYQDKYFDYADGVSANNNPLGSYANSADSKLIPRGGWYLENITESAPGVTPVVPFAATSNTAYITVVFTEPLLMSPFTYYPCAEDEAGLMGIQNINFNINLNPNARIWRSATNYIDTCSIHEFQTAELLFNFVSPKPSQLIASRNSVKYYEIPRFVNEFQTFAAGSFAVPQNKQFNSATIQLNQVPQYLLVWLRKRQNSQTFKNADLFYPIDQVSIQFNNVSGILSSASQQDLYRLSAHNHLNMPYSEWAGVGNVNQGPQTNALDNNRRLIGGPLVLMFGKDIMLQNDYESIGSLGNYNLQVQARGINYGAQDDVELVIATVNVGIFVSERGTSSSYTGVLTRQDVLDAQQMSPMPESDLRRMVGKGWVENLASMLKAGVANAPKVIEKICEVAPGLAKAAKGIMGEGRAGAGMSGGLAKRLK